jgi:Bifunctional DNA primase/polymerase, N-terminal
MAKTFEDPNPHISILDDGLVKKQIKAQAKHALEMADRYKELHLTPEQVEAERFQYASNAYAEENPLYAAARGSTQFLVLPLEPNGTKPLVDPSEATRDDRQLLAWWQEWPNANPGILLGRVGGVVALRFEDSAAWFKFRDTMLKFEEHDIDHDMRWVAYRDLGGGLVRLVPPSEPFTTRMRQGWGRKFDAAIMEMMRKDQQSQDLTFWLLFSYHPVVSGMDAWNFVSRSVSPGVRLLGEGEVMPYDGAILDGGVKVAGFAGGRPPEVPVWLAQAIGKPRSRKVMAAAREQHEATLRAINAHAEGNARALRDATERVRAEAAADFERARKILEEADNG